jgi:hypothetical protein
MFWWLTLKKIKFWEKLIHILLFDFMTLYLKLCGLTAGTRQKYLECKRELSEPWWVIGGLRLVEIRLVGNWKYCPSCLNTYSPLWCLLLKNKHQFTVNSEIHNINTRKHSNIHQPAPDLTGFKQGIYYSGVKIYNNLPPHIKWLSDNPRIFELKLKNVLYLHSFYSEEYFQHQLNS